MSEVSIETLSAQRVVSAVLRQLNEEQIEDAVACFTTDFRYKDHGIGVELKDKDRLTEFFRKARELYPDYFLQTEQTFASGEHVITQWTLQVTITEPFYNGKIADWVDYYEGLTARRTALGAHFTEWVEY